MLTRTRVLVGLLLLLAVLAWSEYIQFGSRSPTLFVVTAVVYVIFSVVCFALISARWQFNLQLMLQISADILFIVLMLHESGGIVEMRGISGVPATTGTFNATARVTSGSQTADVAVALTVTAPTLVTADVVSQILGTRSPLSADDLKYLDLLGNDSGGFDVGDFLAWVNATGAQAPEIAAALARLAPAAPPSALPAPSGVRR